MVFTWEYDGNTFEEKGMIEDSLPEGYILTSFMPLLLEDISHPPVQVNEALQGTPWGGFCSWWCI